MSGEHECQAGGVFGLLLIILIICMGFVDKKFAEVETHACHCHDAVKSK